ncbi:hypothetical protein [Roseicyclus sp.]|uniref:hypothetical protein n=1 Tax=Roseicyclus sp. TaxID=1914329 RepID=UPI003F6CFB65
MTDRPSHPPAPAPDHLGPWPEATIAMLADLGLAEDEIARHLRIDRALVRHLRHRAAQRDSLSVAQNPQAASCTWCPCRWQAALRALFGRR